MTAIDEIQPGQGESPNFGKKSSNSPNLSRAIDAKKEDLETENNHEKSHPKDLQCAQIFSDNFTLKIHTEDRPFSCKFCGSKFKTKTRVKRHELIHTGERPYSCNFCDAKFMDRWTTKRHESRRHRNEIQNLTDRFDFNQKLMDTIETKIEKFAKNSKDPKIGSQHDQLAVSSTSISKTQTTSSSSNAQSSYDQPLLVQCNVDIVKTLVSIKCFTIHFICF